MARYELVIETRGEDSSATATITRVASSLDKFGDAAARASARAQSSLGSLSSQFSQIGSVFIGGLAVQAANGIAQIGTSAIQAGFGFNVMKEQAQIALTTMLGSGEKAKRVMGDLQAFSKATPFEMQDLLPAATSLISFGDTAETVIDTLRRLGDISSGVGAPIGELAELYGKARTQGRLFAQDINQLQGRGIPIVAELAKQFGVSTGEIMKMVEQGKVGFPQLQQAIVALTSEGGKFAGLTEAQSKSFWGQLSTLKDNITTSFATITEPIFNKLRDGMAPINALFDSPAVQAGIQRFAAAIGTGLESAIAFITTRVIPAVQTIVNAFASSNLAGALVGAFTSIGNAVNTSLPALYKFEGEVISGLIPALVAFGQIVGPILGATLMAVIAILRDQVGPALQKIGDVLNTVVFPALKVFLDWVGPKLTPILQTAAQLIGIVIVEGVKKFANQLTMAANQAGAFARAVGQAFQWVLERVADLVQKMGELLNLMPGGKGNDLIAFANSMRGAVNELSIAVQEAVDAGTAYARVNKDDVVPAVTSATNATNAQYNAFEANRFAALAAANANKDFGEKSKQAGEDALAGANAAQQAADIMSKVADKVRGMVEQALNPTTVDQRLQMTGNAWDEFRLRLEAVNSGTPLDQYGAAFVAQVQKMQQITGLALPDIAAKFKDFSLFANMDWLKGALESGAIDLEPIKARINEQIQQIIGQANLMKAAFNEVWAGLSQQTKIDLAGALGLTPDAANNAQQVFAAMSGQGAVTAATQTDAAAKAASALQTGLSGANTNAGNLAAALQKLPQPLSDVKPKLEDLAKLLTDKVNPPMNALSGYFKTATDGVTKLIEDLPTLNGKFDDFVKKIQDITPPLETFLKDVLRPVADTLAEMLDTTLKLVDALHDLAEALKNTKPNEQFESHSPSPFETTLKNILATMGDITSLAPNAFSRLTTPEGFGVGQNVALAGATNGGSAGRQIVFTGNIYVQNPANFDAFMEEINRRVDTIVVNGD